jgi:tetratricopeptide (TPR) repeat protein
MLVILSLGLAANNFMIRNEQKRTQASNDRLKDNLDLSLKTLDEIYLKVLEDRFLRDPNGAKENQELLTKALGFYENFAERNEGDPNVRREVANAYTRAGFMHLRLEHHDKALAMLDRAAAVCARLIEDFPAELEPKRLLAEVHMYKGLALGRMGPYTTEDYQMGIELLEPFLATNQLNAECIETLANLHNLLGLALHRSGDIGQGEIHQLEAIKLQKRVVEQRNDLPSKIFATLQLAWFHSDLGFLLLETDRHEEAAKEHRLVISIVTQLDAQASTLPDYRRGRLPGFRPEWSIPEALAEAHMMLGRELRELGQSREAETNLKRSLEYWARVVKDWPGEPRQYMKLANVKCSLGLLLFEGGQRPEGLQHLDEAIALVRKVVDQSPSDREYQNMLSTSLTLNGHLLLAQGEREQAAEQFCQALNIREELADRHSTIPSDLNELAWFLASCPDPQFRDPDRAISLAQKALQKVKDNGIIWNTLGIAQFRAGQWREAIVSLEKSMERNKGGDSYDWLFLAMAHWRLGEKEEARRWYDKADKELKKFEYPHVEEGRWLAEAAALLQIKGGNP